MTFAITRHAGAAQSTAERELDDAGLPLPLPQRVAFAAALGEDAVALYIVRDATGAAIAAAGVRAARTRAFPGHHVLRVQRLGVSAVPGASAALLVALADSARRDPRCLRLTVELFDERAELRHDLGPALRGAGFRPRRARSYVRTLSLDLSPGESELFGAFKPITRRNVRKPFKSGLIVRPIDDAATGPRLAELSREVFRRRGARPAGVPWDAIVRYSVATPHQSRLVGVFDPTGPDQTRLLAFAWGCNHGRYATYEAGASTRDHPYGRLALSYALMWDLICWARAGGAQWFDLGGITLGTARTPADPVGGISDFKRAFASNIIDVGEEWAYEPNWAKAAIASVVSAVAQRFRS